MTRRKLLTQVRVTCPIRSDPRPSLHQRHSFSDHFTSPRLPVPIMTQDSILSPSSPHTADRQMKRRPRKPLSCEPCRHSKLRCDRQLPCSTCLRRGWQASCSYSPASCRRVPQRRRVLHAIERPLPQPQPQPQHQHQHQPSEPSEPETELGLPRSQSPEAIQSRWDAVLCRPPVEPTPPAPTDVPFALSFGPGRPVAELLAAIPPDPVCEYLVTRYFATLSPLFHILHGPTFQKQYWAFLQNPQQTDLSWLALLYAICGLTLKTIPPTDPGLAELWKDSSTPRDLSALSLRCREAAMMCLSQDQFLVRHNLNTLEALLILIHTIANTEGTEYGWVLLGNAMHIAIALRCHINGDSPNFIERERRRRCWAGILILHTDQTLLYRDIDMSSLANMKATMPADVNDEEIQENAILTSPAQALSRRVTHMSLIRFHFQLFQLSSRVHNHVSGPNQLDAAALGPFDAEISEQQQQWDSLYLVNGARSILDTAGYAHWCILQTYAHQLYLLLHRPFHHSRSSRFRPDSRDRCAQSGLALLDIHRQFFQLPRLKCYRWLVNGTISCNALHGAVALTSCLLDMPNDADFTEHLAVIDAAVVRVECLKRKSPACSHIYPILRCLQ